MNIIHFLRLIRFELASCFAEAYINSKFNSFWDYKRHIINKLHPPHMQLIPSTQRIQTGRM